MPLAEQTQFILQVAPTFAVEIVDPEQATLWLRANTRNRHLRPATILQYSRDMLAGAWQLTGEAIKFAGDGTLLDGQHRLAAVVKAGIPVPMVVARGVQFEAQGVMDSGRKRTSADQFTLAGKKNSTLLAAGAGLVMKLDSETPIKPTHTEIRAWVAEHPEIEDQAAVVTRLRHTVDMTPKLALASYHLLSRIDPLAATEFIFRTADGINLEIGHPVLALRNRLREIRMASVRYEDSVYLSLIFRAWNAYRKGEQLTILRVNSAKASETSGPTRIAIPRPS